MAWNINFGQNIEQNRIARERLAAENARAAAQMAEGARRFDAEQKLAREKLAEESRQANMRDAQAKAAAKEGARQFDATLRQQQGRLALDRDKFNLEAKRQQQQSVWDEAINQQKIKEFEARLRNMEALDRKYAQDIELNKLKLQEERRAAEEKANALNNEMGSFIYTAYMNKGATPEMLQSLKQATGADWDTFQVGADGSLHFLTYLKDGSGNPVIGKDGTPILDNRRPDKGNMVIPNEYVGMQVEMRTGINPFGKKSLSSAGGWNADRIALENAKLDYQNRRLQSMENMQSSRERIAEGNNATKVYAVDTQREIAEGKKEVAQERIKEQKEKRIGDHALGNKKVDAQKEIAEGKLKFGEEKLKTQKEIAEMQNQLGKDKLEEQRLRREGMEDLNYAKIESAIDKVKLEWAKLEHQKNQLRQQAEIAKNQAETNKDKIGVNYRQLDLQLKKLAQQEKELAFRQQKLEKEAEMSLRSAELQEKKITQGDRKLDQREKELEARQKGSAKDQAKMAKDAQAYLRTADATGMNFNPAYTNQLTQVQKALSDYYAESLGVEKSAAPSAPAEPEDDGLGKPVRVIKPFGDGKKEVNTGDNKTETETESSAAISRNRAIEAANRLKDRGYNWNGKEWVRTEKVSSAKGTDKDEEEEKEED